MNNLQKVGEYDGKYNNLLNIHLPSLDIYKSTGLRTHIENRHRNCLQYLDNIQDIIASPDYVGKNPSEPNSIELVKVFDNNIQIAIKLDKSRGYLYVATLFEVSESKVQRRLNSGRYKIVP